MFKRFSAVLLTSFGKRDCCLARPIDVTCTGDFIYKMGHGGGFSL